jgi:hypothetical protein
VAEPGAFPVRDRRPTLSEPRSEGVVEPSASVPTDAPSPDQTTPFSPGRRCAAWPRRCVLDACEGLALGGGRDLLRATYGKLGLKALGDADGRKADELDRKKP